MASRRTLKIAESIRKIVSMALLAEIRDPRVGLGAVNVTRVEVSGDLQHAKVFVMIRGDQNKQRLGLNGLRSASGFLQSKIAKGLELRYTPRLHFEIDSGVQKSLEVARILKEVLPGDQSSGTADESATDRQDPRNQAENLTNPQATPTDLRPVDPEAPAQRRPGLNTSSDQAPSEGSIT